MTSAAPFDPRDAASPRRMQMLFGVLPVVAILIFVLGVAFGIEGEDIGLLALALVTALVACMPLVRDQGRPASQRRILLSIFSLVYLAHYVVPVATSYIPAQGPVDAPGWALSQLRPRDIAVGQLVALTGLAGLLFGHAAAGARWFARSLPRATRDWSPPVVVAVAFSMIAGGWMTQVLSSVGLLPPELGSGILSTLGSALIYGNVLLTYAVLRHGSRVAFLTLVFTIPVTSALGFFTGSRTAVLVVPMIVALTVMVYRRRIRARWLLLGVLALSLLYPASSFFREVILVGNTLSAVDALRDPNETMSRVSDFLSGSRPSEYFLEGLESTGARLDGLGATSVIVRDTPDRVPYQNGRTLGLFFVAFVPRAFWPGKPTITIGQWITDTYGSGFEIESNSAPTTLGDYYLNFGLAGAIGGMILLGGILRVTHESLLARQPTAPGMLAAVVILYHLTLRFEGNVAGQYAGTVFALAPILAAHLVIRVIVPPPRPTPDDASGVTTAGARLGA